MIIKSAKKCSEVNVEFEGKKKYGGPTIVHYSLSKLKWKKIMFCKGTIFRDFLKGRFFCNIIQDFEFFLSWECKFAYSECSAVIEGAKAEI